MGKVRIEFDAIIPDIEHTDEELEEWLRYEFGDNGSMSLKNPFAGKRRPEPIFGTFDFEEQP